MTLLRALFLACLSPIVGIGWAQTDGWPQTLAERTDYKETSHYSDVIEFIEALQKKGAPISVQYIGASKEGKRMPLVISARPMISSPAEARRTGKPIVYIQANIHAGEVEGKEAALAILRRVCQDKAGLLDKLILLVDPIYNIDGNEKFGPQERNRPEQNGPALVGLRTSGEGFDLNRDGVKTESLEFRALLANLYTTWDPDVMMDLHTTDGTRHGYELTYAAPENPNTAPEIMRFSRDEMLPKIRQQIKKEDGLELFDYGDATRRNGQVGWTTFGEGGRYMTNYVGLRNRIAILSEATTYIPFKDRVIATDKFVMAVLNYIAKNSKRVLDLTRNSDALVASWGADPSKAPDLGVRFEMAPRGDEETILEKIPAAGQPRPSGRPTELTRVKMPIFDRFKVTKTSKIPATYIIPAGESKIVDLLRRHGIVVEKLLESVRATISAFEVSEIKTETQAFQGHHLAQLDGKFAQVPMTIESGSYLVPMNQPLGILIFNMLEPESSDGVATWGLLAAEIKSGEKFPILKCFEPIHAVTERVP